MKNTLFIQFYLKVEKLNNFDFVLWNGFSDTYDLCKSKGDFIWINEELAEEYELPFDSGDVYISAYLTDHLTNANNWAKQYPNINFIVGGPVILCNNNFVTILSKNLKLVKSSVEDYFDKPNFSYKWKIDISQIKKYIDKTDNILFSYTLDTSCFWKKCTYCNYSYDEHRVRDLVDLSVVDDIDFDGVKQIRLNTPGISISFINKIFDQMIYRKDIVYDTLMRCDLKKYRTLENRLTEFKGTLPNLKMRIGIEFPSNKMLKRIRKGFNVNDILNTLRVLNKFENTQSAGMFMFGWCDIDQSDIDEVLYFIDNVKRIDDMVFYKVLNVYGTALHEMYKDSRVGEKYYEGPIYRGYYMKLTSDELMFNKQAIKLIKQIPHNTILNRVEEYLFKY